MVVDSEETVMADEAKAEDAVEEAKERNKMIKTSTSFIPQL